MISFRVLSQFDDGNLKVYGRLQTDFGFINQLVAFYQRIATGKYVYSGLGSHE